VEASMVIDLILTLLGVALIAALLGFGGIAGVAVGGAELVFVVAIAIFVLAVLGRFVHATLLR
jgi:uncharacterized membrane protein YtjA (UPF0391 family)